MPEELVLDTDELGPAGKRFVEFCHSRIIGQDEAVDSLAKAIDYYESGMRDLNRPIHVAFLIGGPGSGKTLLVKTFAEFFIGTSDAALEFSMSFLRRQISNLSQQALNHHDFINRCRADKETKEYSEFEEEKEGIEEELKILRGRKDKEEDCRKKQESLAARLKEIDKGLVVLESKQERVFNESKSVVVFDHLEDGESEDQSIVSEILDKGRLVINNKGVVSFCNSVIFITCNDVVALKNSQQKEIGFVKNDDAKLLPKTEVYLRDWKEIKNLFSVRFLSRIGRVYLFEKYDGKILLEILELLLKELQTRLAKEFPILFLVDNDVKEFITRKILENSEHPEYKEYGIRELKRKFEKYIVRLIGRLKNRGAIKIGDKIHICLNKEKKIEFYKEKIEEQPR